MATQRALSQIDTLFVHCAATPNGKRFTAANIDQWHKERGFRRDPSLIGYQQPKLLHIGYHFVIQIGGAVETGRSKREIGAHAVGHNTTSIGICMIGTDRFTAAQWASLKALVESLCKELPGIKRVRGHNEVSAKTCPGFSVAEWLANGMQPLANHLLKPE